MADAMALALQDWLDATILWSWEADEIDGALVGDTIRLAAKSLVQSASMAGIELDARGDDFEQRNRFEWVPGRPLPMTNHGYCRCGFRDEG